MSHKIALMTFLTNFLISSSSTQNFSKSNQTEKYTVSQETSHLYNFL